MYILPISIQFYTLHLTIKLAFYFYKYQFQHIFGFGITVNSCTDHVLHSYHLAIKYVHHQLVYDYFMVLPNPFSPVIPTFQCLYKVVCGITHISLLKSVQILVVQNCTISETSRSLYFVAMYLCYILNVLFMHCKEDLDKFISCFLPFYVQQNKECA